MILPRKCNETFIGPVQGSRRGIGRLRTRGVPSQGIGWLRVRRDHVGGSGGLRTRGDPDWRARVGSAAVGIHPGTPTPSPRRALQANACPPRCAEWSCAPGGTEHGDARPPALGLVNREVVNAESTARLCGDRGYWEQSQLLLLTWRWVDDLCVGQRQRKWSPCSCGNRPSAVANGPRHR